MIYLIKHVVMWKLKESAEGNSKEENAKLMKSKLEALPGEIKELKELEVGINIVEDPGAYDIVLYTAFNDKNDLKTYGAHPTHLEVVEFIKKVVAARVVVDYED